MHLGIKPGKAVKVALPGYLRTVLLWTRGLFCLAA